MDKISIAVLKEFPETGYISFAELYNGTVGRKILDPWPMHELVSSLIDKEYLAFEDRTSTRPSDPSARIGITASGLMAIREYDEITERHQEDKILTQQKQKLWEEANRISEQKLSIADEANRIAKESNRIASKANENAEAANAKADKADKHAKYANIIAVISIVSQLLMWIIPRLCHWNLPQ